VKAPKKNKLLRYCLQRSKAPGPCKEGVGAAHFLLIPYESLHKKQAFEVMSLTWEKDWPCKRVGAPPLFGKALRADYQKLFNQQNELF